MWYTKAESARRFCLWYCGLGLGQIVGGLASYVPRISSVLIAVSHLRLITGFSTSHCGISRGMANHVHHAWRRDNRVRTDRHRSNA